MKLLAYRGVIVSFFASLVLNGVSYAQERHGWITSSEGLTFYNAAGKANAIFGFEDEEIIISTSAGFTEKSVVKITGGSSSDGKFGWLDRREHQWLIAGDKGAHSFKFYGPEGKLLWEKDGVVGSTLSDDGNTVFLLEVPAQWVHGLEYGNSTARPTIYDSGGHVLMDFEGCGTNFDVPILTRNGRYGAFTCWPANSKEKPFAIIFEIPSKKKVTYYFRAPTDTKISEDGKYQIFEEKRAYDRISKKLIVRSRDIVLEGKFK